MTSNLLAPRLGPFAPHLPQGHGDREETEHGRQVEDAPPAQRLREKAADERSQRAPGIHGGNGDPQRPAPLLAADRRR